MRAYDVIAGGSMAKLKTRRTRASVTEFIDAVGDPVRKSDARQVAAMMRKATGARARMWGPSIVGFGSYRYTNSAGKQCEWMLTGMSPRKTALTIYIMPGFENYAALMNGLGSYKTGRSCLYIKRLADVDTDVLAELIERSVADMRRRYDSGD